MMPFKLFCRPFFGTSLVLGLWSPLALGQSEGSPQPSFFLKMFPFVVMFFIIYLLVIRPQAKKQKAHQDFLGKLKKGDQVLTSAGVFGTIEGITERYVKLEVAHKVSLRVLKSHISQSVKE